MWAFNRQLLPPSSYCINLFLSLLFAFHCLDYFKIYFKIHPSKTAFWRAALQEINVLALSTVIQCSLITNKAGFEFWLILCFSLRSSTTTAQDTASHFLIEPLPRPVKPGSSLQRSWPARPSFTEQREAENVLWSFAAETTKQHTPAGLKPQTVCLMKRREEKARRDQ